MPMFVLCNVACGKLKLCQCGPPPLHTSIVKRLELPPGGNAKAVGAAEPRISVFAPPPVGRLRHRCC